MLRTSDVELLSRFLAGELNEVESQALELELATRPELQRALGRLKRLEEVSRALGERDDRESPPAPEHVIRRVVEQTRPRRAPRYAAFAAAAAILLIALWFGGRTIAPEEAPANVAERTLPVAEPTPTAANRTNPVAEPTAPVAERIARDEKTSRTVAKASPPPSTRAPAVSGLSSERFPFAGGRVEVVARSRWSRQESGAIALESGTLIAENLQKGVIEFAGNRYVVDGDATFSTQIRDAVERVARDVAVRPRTLHATNLRILVSALKKPLEEARAAVFVISGEAEVDNARGKTLLRAPSIDSIPHPAREKLASLSGVFGPEPESPVLLAGRISTQQVFRVASDSRHILKCYSSALKKDPSLNGTLKLRLTLTAADGFGKLKEAAVSEGSTLTNPTVVRCVRKILSAATWPTPEEGDAVVEIPYLFTPPSALEPQAKLQMKGFKPPPPGGPRKEQIGRARVDAGNAVFQGPDNASMTVIAFTDFECMSCMAIIPELLKLQRAFSKEVRVAIRHRPPPSQPNARVAAAASIAARQQGKFWAFTSALQKAPRERGPEAMLRMAEKLGLDIAMFEADMESAATQAELESDLAEAARLGIRENPTVYFNGREVVGEGTFGKYRLIVGDELGY